MNYLAHSTLKTFLYLLYGKSSLLLYNFKYPERESIVMDIFSNNIASLFIFKNSVVTIEKPSLEDITMNLYDISSNIKTFTIELCSDKREELLNYI